MSVCWDVAIVGSGFAGSILARVLRRRGMRVLLLERGRHPRFALGESSTPLAGFALERLAEHYDLPDLRQLSTHGRWLRGLPHLRRGLKRGFTFFHHRPGEPYRNTTANEARLLVAASPDDAIADTHWLRADVDAHLVKQAVKEGVDYLDHVSLDGIAVGDPGFDLHGSHESRRRHFRVGRVIDASGPGGFLARHLPIASGPEPTVETGLLYSHFEGLRPFEEVAHHATLEPGPYPDERAAVHHLLEEGWMYVLPFDHGAVSAGIVLRTRDSRLTDEEIAEDPAAAWREVLRRYPTLKAQFGDAEPQMPIRYVPTLPHRLSRAAGERWALLPHAYAFYDPLFSTGIAWSLLGIERLANVLDGSWGDLDLYAQRLEEEADQIDRLIAAAHLAMGDFERFTAVSFLYFATVSFAEARQRLLPEQPGEPPHAWEGFLGSDDPLLYGLFTEARERLEKPGFAEWIARGIAPRNVVGVADPTRRNLYPVDLEVLVERAGLLGLGREEVVAALPLLRGTQERVLSRRTD